MELIYITRPLLVISLILLVLVIKYSKKPENKTFRWIVRWHNKLYGFTYTADEIKTYSFGGQYFENDVMIEDTTEFWNQIGLGFYRKSDSWRS